MSATNPFPALQASLVSSFYLKPSPAYTYQLSVQAVLVALALVLGLATLAVRYRAGTLWAYRLQKARDGTCITPNPTVVWIFWSTAFAAVLEVFIFVFYRGTKPRDTMNDSMFWKCFVWSYSGRGDVAWAMGVAPIVTRDPMPGSFDLAYHPHFITSFILTLALAGPSVITTLSVIINCHLNQVFATGDTLGKLLATASAAYAAADMATVFELSPRLEALTASAESQYAAGLQWWRIVWICYSCFNGFICLVFVFAGVIHFRELNSCSKQMSAIFWAFRILWFAAAIANLIGLGFLACAVFISIKAQEVAPGSIVCEIVTLIAVYIFAVFGTLSNGIVLTRTIVVLVGTILLIIVSVSVPILKSIYFLKASVSATVDSTNVTSGQITMGMWGYCVGSTCSNVTLGYTLTNIDELFGISGLAADIPVDIPTTLIKWLTYVLVLHPIAAGFAVIATVCGLLAHIREFAITGFTTCFAGFASFFALVAFIFDIVLFEIAKKRIIAAGGTASLGNAIWMTLVAMLCLMFSGCFFGLGRCLVRNRQPRREASEKNKPQPDAQYGNSMRQDALGGGYGQGQGEYEQGFGQAPMYGQGAPSQSSKTGSLPAFQEFGDRDGEIIPLTSVRPDYDDDDEHVGYRDETRTEAASLVSGVGMGYGRRTDQGTPVPIRPDSQVYSSQQSLPPPPRRNTSVSNSTVSPFVGMSQAGPEQSAYAFAPPSSPPPNVAGAGGYRTPGRSPPPQNAYAAPLPPVDYAGPPPAVAFAGTSYPQDKGATAYTAYPPPPSQSGTASYYGSPPPQQQYFSPPPQQQYSSPPPQQQYSSPPPPQQYYAQNPSQDSHYAPPASIAPSYSTHPPQEASASAFGGAAVAGGSQYAYGAGQGGLDQYGFPVQQQVEHQQLPSGHNPYDQRSPYDQ